MGGEHITSEDMFKSAEIVRRNAEALEVEKDKDKKRRLEYRARREAALPVLDRFENVLENAVTWLTGKELEVLLRWKGVPVSKMGNVANRRVLYQQFTDGGGRGRGRCEHARPMDRCRRGGTRGAEERAH